MFVSPRADPPDMRPRLFPLVLCSLASQAQLVVLAPMIAAVAADFHVPVGVVGQARSVTALVAIAATVVLTRRSAQSRTTPTALAVAGAAVSVAGSAAIATASGLQWFLLAHLLVGVGLAVLLSSAFSGVAAFPRTQRLRVAGWVAAGNALAWIVVAPTAGVMTQELSWRAAQAMPMAAAVAALVGARWVTPGHVGSETRDSSVMRDRSARQWVIGESVAYAAWTALLTYVGAYFGSGFAIGAGAVGLVLASGAAAYALASTRVGMLGAWFSSRRLVVISTGALAVLVPILLAGSASLPLAVSLFCLVGLSAGVRTPSSAALGLAQLEGHPTAVMTARTGATQAGYLVGAAVGGPVISALGYGALGLLLAVGLLASVGLLVQLNDAGPRQPRAMVAAAAARPARPCRPSLP